MKIHILICTLILSSLFFFSKNTCSQTIIKGRVISYDNNEPIANASVYIPSKKVGTITNKYGEFEFVLKNCKRQDSLLISIIGYQSIYIALDSIINKNCAFLLKTKPFVLKEIDINADKLNAIEILKKAKENVLSNYNTDTILVEGFYRQFLKYDSTYKRSTEVAFTLYDEGLEKTYYDTSFIPDIEINGIIKSHDYRTGWDTVDHIFDGLKRLWYYGREVPFPDRYQRLKYKYNIDSIIYLDSNWVYVISKTLKKGESIEMSSCLTDTKGQIFSLSDYKIEGVSKKSVYFINSKDYSVLKYFHNWNYSKSPLLKIETMKTSKDFIQFEYSIIGEKLVPYHLKDIFEYVVFNDKQTDTIVTFEVYREIYVNNVTQNVSNIRSYRPYELPYQFHFDMHDINIKYDSLFWSNYRYHIKDSIWYKANSDFEEIENSMKK